MKCGKHRAKPCVFIEDKNFNFSKEWDLDNTTN